MGDDELSDRIARACVGAGRHPWHDDADFPSDLPCDPLQVYSVLRFEPTDRDPMVTWQITVMLAQQAGSMSYWLPATLIGPNQGLEDRGVEPDEWDLGWRMHFDPQWGGAPYEDMISMSQEWWPTLEHWWWDVPSRYKDYDPRWRRRSSCYRCGCTGIIMWHTIQLPCPRCRTTPRHTRIGYRSLVWVPAHTRERLPHAEVRKRWRYHGEPYVVEQVLGNRAADLEAWPEWNTLHVGLRRREAWNNPGAVYRFDSVPPGWGDHDVDSERAVTMPSRRPGPLRRLHRRVAGWFDPSLVEG